jgi:tRNA(Ile)-lysidine synthase
VIGTQLGSGHRRDDDVDAIALSTKIEGLIGRPLGGEAFAVAVSGGPDSLALLLLAHAAFGDRVRALTVDHALRTDSAAEAAMVAGVCAGRGIPHAALRWEGAKPTANIQAHARGARYALMTEWCAANGVLWLATGHHADDQAETLLMRLARGSGSGGLAGIRTVRPLGQGITLLRPLLDVRRAALRRVVDAAGLIPVDDPANRSPRHDRTAARALLAATPWLDPVRLAASAAHLADAEAALEWTTQLAWDSRAEATAAGLTLDVADLPAELRRRLVARAFATLGESPDGPAIERLVGRLTTGATATLGGVQVRPGARWTFRRVGSRVIR